MVDQAITKHLGRAPYPCGWAPSPCGGCQEGPNEFDIFSNFFDILSFDILDFDIKS
jgi:hypothetical protein